eukprot:3669577-Prymnesium_polylepis.1
METRVGRGGGGGAAGRHRGHRSTCIVSRIVPERTKGRVAARAARTGRRGAVRHGCALGLAP